MNTAPRQSVCNISSTVPVSLLLDQVVQVSTELRCTRDCDFNDLVSVLWTARLLPHFRGINIPPKLGSVKSAFRTEAKSLPFAYTC